MSARTFSEVRWVAEHVPETHRTLENDRTITTVELPGTVNLYVEIDGGRILMDQLNGGKVLEAVDAARKARAEPEQPQE